MAVAVAEAEAAASVLSEKPHFRVPEPAPIIGQIPSKSHSNSLCKALIIVLLLLVIPLFPSQAPDFISQNIFTELWEIIHLLFIGIAVSYGLFSRRTAEMVPERIVHPRNDDSGACLSGISHLSSIFEDGFENICGPDGQDVMQNYDQFLGKDKCVVHGGGIKTGSFVPNDGTEDVCEGNWKCVNQAWCSQYLRGESLVVVSNGKYFLGGSSNFKPLNLPVRSLRSSVVDNEKPELKNRHDSRPKIEAKANDVKVLKIRGVVPSNLEKKFEEAAGSSSIPWRSRSGRMENGEELINPKPPVHCRPHSVGEFEFEHLKSKSFLGPKYSSSAELVSSKGENMEGKRLFSVSRPKVAPLNAEASIDGPKTQPFSIAASSELNRLGDLECNSKNFCNHGDVDKVGKGKQAIESLNSGINSSALAKVLSRAKSVRTIKSSRCIMDEKEKHLSQIDGSMCTKFEADSLVKRGREEEQENPPVNHKNQQLGDHIFPMPKPKPNMIEFHNEGIEDIDNRNVRESEEDAESELDKSSDEDDAGTNFDNDAELEGSEVDRKAGEFIAKFREQIRLQKLSSAEGCSGW